LRDSQPNRLGSLEIDHQIKSDRTLNRQISWAFAPQKATSIGTHLAKCIDEVGPVAEERTFSDRFTHRNAHGDLVLRGQVDELILNREKETLHADQECAGLPAKQRCD